MAQVNMKVVKPIEVMNTDTEISISTPKAGKIGTLTISRGGIEWWPRGHSANAHKCSWEKLAKVIEDHVPPKRARR